MMTYKRFFAFGCSFTSWHWPTWADIIGQTFNEESYFNFGLCGSGNEFAFHKLTEAHARFNITKDDLVIICWTNFAREDRYFNGDWQPAGNIFTQDLYSQDWVKQWFDLRGALIKTSSVIAGATHLLDSIGCNYLFTSMMPMTQIDQADTLFAGDEFQDVFSTYNKYYQNIKTSIVEQVYGENVWKNPNPVFVKWSEEYATPWFDHHPSPVQHLDFFNEVINVNLVNPINVSNNTIDWVNAWESKVRNPPYFDCDKHGWSVYYRTMKHHKDKGML